MKKVRFNLSKNKTILFFKNDTIANIKDKTKWVKKKSRINILIPIIPLFILILILIYIY